ncbi:MAG: hypothetical protein NPIRA01_38960 [Nitrospirales bacterium]|nr:MAG: hypothetical protein NPIRA01_38960 [Nitrospirales bacterium]
MDHKPKEVESRKQRAFRIFHAAVAALLKTHAPTAAQRLPDILLSKSQNVSECTEYWEQFRGECEDLAAISYRHGSLTQAIEWEVLKLQTRINSASSCQETPSVPLFRDRHVHIGTLIQLWQRLSLETEHELAKQGYDTLFDVGPWGGFNFAVQEDGYTRMPFARLTLAVGSLPSTPIEDQGGPFYKDFLPRYLAALESHGVTIPYEFEYQHHKYDDSGRLEELSCTYHFPHHTYERRSFVKVRLSRAFETVEEMTLYDFLGLLERLHFTTDWDAYREQTKDIDARFDLQDFISLSHITEGVYQRTVAEEDLLVEIKDAFRGAIRDRKILYQYLDVVKKSKWIENLYWGIAERALGIRKYQRPVSFTRDVCTQMPPRLLIPVRRHLQDYHRRLDSVPTSASD